MLVSHGCDTVCMHRLVGMKPAKRCMARNMTAVLTCIMPVPVLLVIELHLRRSRVPASRRIAPPLAEAGRAAVRGALRGRLWYRRTIVLIIQREGLVILRVP